MNNGANGLVRGLRGAPGLRRRLVGLRRPVARNLALDRGRKGAQILHVSLPDLRQEMGSAALELSPAAGQHARDAANVPCAREITLSDLNALGRDGYGAPVMGFGPKCRTASRAIRSKREDASEGRSRSL